MAAEINLEPFRAVLEHHGVRCVVSSRETDDFGRSRVVLYPHSNDLHAASAEILDSVIGQLKKLGTQATYTGERNAFLVDLPVVKAKGVKTPAILRAVEQVQKEGEGIIDHLLTHLVSEAAVYFEECPDDFCLQHVGAESLVFGGTNRLIWSPLRSFFPDPTYCTKRFLLHALQVKS